MMNDQFEVRGKALEEEFFARQNARLKASFQRQLRETAANEALSATTGITDPVVLDHMREVGLTPRTAAAFTLVPLIFTAWADGQLDERERRAVLSAAREQGSFPERGPAGVLLEQWLKARPPPKLLRVWREYARALAATLDADARRAFAEALVDRAERVARASGGRLGVGQRVSARERQLLDELANAFR